MRKKKDFINKYKSSSKIWLFPKYLDEIDTYGHEIAIQRSIEIAISVLTDADTDTPCI